MKEEKRKRNWLAEAVKFAGCAGLLVLAWWLWQRNLGPEIREVLFPKPRLTSEATAEGGAKGGPAAAGPGDAAPRTSDAR